MSRRILFIFLVLSLTMLPFSRLHAQVAISPSQVMTEVPSQLKPPSEDVAQLDEDIDNWADEKIYNIPVILNDSVENQMEYFESRGRDIFQLWLDRSARYIQS